MKFILPLLLSFGAYIGLHGQCLSAGANSVGGTSNNTSTGSFSWSDVSNAQTSDNSYATSGQFVNALSTVNSNYLVASNLGFSIPGGAVICGIVVEVEGSATGLGIGSVIRDNSLRIVKGGAITGSEHASATAWPGSDANRTYGSNSDLWGTTWTPADINATNFGMAISARIYAGIAGLFLTPRIDEIRITVYYNTPLPVKLKSFTAKQVSSKVKLEWVTTTETNNKLFVVERSLDNSLWSGIDSLHGSGDSYSDRYYHAFDHFPGAVNYYRLKQVDFDRRSAFSKVVTVNTSNDFDSKVKLSFNRPWLSLTVSTYTEIKKIQFFNINSTEVFPLLISGQAKNKMYNTTKLCAGSYFIRIYMSEEVITKKIVIK